MEHLEIKSWGDLALGLLVPFKRLSGLHRTSTRTFVPKFRNHVEENSSVTVNFPLRNFAKLTLISSSKRRSRPSYMRVAAVGGVGGGDVTVTPPTPTSQHLRPSFKYL